MKKTKITPEYAQFAMDTLKTFEDYRDSLYESLKRSKGILSRQNYIVVCGLYGVEFEADSKGIIINTNLTRPDVCTRLEKHTAERVAPKVSNGNGDKGKAVLWIDAVNDTIKRLENQIDQFTKIISPY